jgi:hypothetical protein
VGGIELFVLLGCVLFGLETLVPVWFCVVLFFLTKSVRFLITTGNLLEVLLVIGLLKNPWPSLLKLGGRNYWGSFEEIGLRKRNPF